MRKITLTLICAFLMSHFAQAQVYSDHFDNDDPALMGGSGTYSFSEANSELTVTGSNTGPWDVFTYQLHNPSDNSPLHIDVSGNNKVYVRAKASNVGTQLRLDLQDTAGYVTSSAGLTKTLTTDFAILEFDFLGQYIDGGFGGTACNSGPCGVDSSTITSLVMFTNPGAGGFNGTVIIDYISFGQPPDTVITSDIFQDHFEDTSSVNSFTFVGGGYSVSQSGSSLHIDGDGTTAMWDPLTYVFIDHVNNDTFDIDITGNNKLYVKVKSTVAGTAFRIDAQDIDGFVSTQGSITKIVDTAYTVLEYDFTGVLADLGYGGTPCTQATAPCPVNGSRIADLLFFIEPGVGAYTGTLSIDYMSFGVSLEPLGPEPELVYEDHFGNETLEYTNADAGYVANEVGSDLIITGDSTAAPYSAISYLLHDKDSAAEIFVNMIPGGNKLYIRAKVDEGTVPIRIDLIDTANFITSEPALTKVISDEYQIFEYNFDGLYFDGGFGGTPCMTGPCPVDPKSIKQILIYIDPVQGGFNGEVSIDFISIGKPAGDDLGPKGVVNYIDQMDDDTQGFITDMAGLVSVTANDEWTITGDGTSGPWGPVVYTAHNEMGEEILIDAAGSNDKLYVRAKASVDSTLLRIDLQDNGSYVSNLNAVANTLSTEYAVYEYDFTGSYEDGAFGGSPCATSPCPVDAERIAQLQVFINPGTGMYNGTVTIDWISFGTNSVAIKDIFSVETLRAYPNPVNDKVRVEYNLSNSSKVDIYVSSLMGQRLIHKSLNQQTGLNIEEIDVNQLAKGIYFLQIHTNGKLAGTVRLLKN